MSRWPEAAALGVVLLSALLAATWPAGADTYASQPAQSAEAPAAPDAGAHTAAPQPHPPAKGAGMGGALLPACAPVNRTASAAARRPA